MRFWLGGICVKKIPICVLVISLLILSSTAFATNWVFIDKSNNSVMGDFTTYVDRDTVVQNSNNVIYWTLQILDRTGPFETKKILTKIEALPSNPRQERALEFYFYDTNNNVVFQSTTPGDKFNPADSSWDGQINFAIQNAKEGKDFGQKPSP